MTSSRDLLEAQSWARRRLLAAYLGGEPRPQLRPILAGVLLAGVLVGGCALRAWLG